MSAHIRYTDTPHKDRDDVRNLRRLSPYLWEYRGRVLAALGFLVFARGAAVGVPILLKYIVDDLNAGRNRIAALPLALLLGYGALRLVGSLFNELRDTVFARVRYRAMRRLSIRVLDHLHSLALRFHLERRTGAISRDLERGTRSVSSLLNYMVFNLLPTAVEVALVVGILLAHYDVMFTVVTLGAVIGYVAFTLLVTEWRMEFRHRMNALESRANNQAIDSLINYETVKYFNNEAFESQRYDSTLRDWEDTAVRTQASMSVLNFGQGAIIAVAVTGIMILAARGVAAGRLTIGDLVLVNAFLLQLFTPLNFLGVVYRQTKYALADMDLLFKLLEREPEVRDLPGAPDLRVEGGEVRFEHVDFSYQPERRILRDVDFVIPAGSKIAVVGPSGAGKSTLARLLYRFYDVGAGAVRIDGQDLREVTQRSVRDAVGIVPQDTVLFNDTIYFNIAYARRGARREEVVRAARLAHVHEFIEALPRGYDTVVGERGLKLSGGEKQRVAIARVILKNPPILIFDEATSSLDSASERAIQSSLREVAENRTTLVIAHRLSTVVDAERILVFDRGRIVERGTHAELLARGGLYARLWSLQQREGVVGVDMPASDSGAGTAPGLDYTSAGP